MTLVNLLDFYFWALKNDLQTVLILLALHNICLLKDELCLRFFGSIFFVIFLLLKCKVRRFFLRVDVIIIEDVRRHKKVKLGIIHG